MQSLVTTLAFDRVALQRNILTASLGAADAAMLAPYLCRVSVSGGMRLPGGGVDAQVWFPETLVASICETLADGTQVDVGVVGSEGMIGWPVLLSDERVVHGSVARLDGGTALTMAADALVDLCDRRPSLRASLLRFVQSYTVQLAQTVASSLRDGIDARLARLLLMLHDRIAGDDLAVTHIELSAALNVRRASVTDWLHILEGDRIVRCTRGRIVVRDRVGLRAIAGASYGGAEASYSRLIGPFGKG
ncbi:helix-turn-helix domain-containing protein [Sphingomonas donggukensis]|uniref:Helix-turn-helix domain-containing protein n=1 Tax=Sphingomonas donggukensis TaxID=2949093 RepID=A0ABY4TQI2_9SPHN|nr:helix-turn-helix domain-containing protein [Sphingomonas donggukensis]URW74654.1 helix-turn-helix domain-containing protein [Sphingomonas donggukensis]